MSDASCMVMIVSTGPGHKFTTIRAADFVWVEGRTTREVFTAALRIANDRYGGHKEWEQRAFPFMCDADFRKEYSWACEYFRPGAAWMETVGWPWVIECPSPMEDECLAPR